jgi:protein-S-isoprenylcysteine O-methyltransferase Ste14
MDMSNPPAIPAKPPRPESAVSAGSGLVGLIGLFAWIAFAKSQGMDGTWSALANVVACGLPMVLWSVFVDKVYNNPTTGIDWSLKRPLKEILDTSLTKLTGLWATWGLIASVYCIFRFYWRDNYLFAMEMLEATAPFLLAASIPYVMWLDRQLKNPKDASWHFGALILGLDGVDKVLVQHHLRAWAVKGFFCAFMLSIVPGGFADVIRAPWSEIMRNPVALGNWLISLMFVIDVAFATVGYMLTMKPLDSHIRTANPFMMGWVAALMCYPPFVLMGGNSPLNYHVNTESWSYWFDGHPTMLAIWAALLVILTAIYAWATVAFGIRFSNLTNRGVLTHGPYAFTKHPAYLAKNTFWWLETLPFLVTSASLVDSIRNTVILAMVSGVYFWRAKTEEKHLKLDEPIYHDYEAWMAEHGAITSRINRLLGRNKKTAVALTPAE